MMTSERDANGRFVPGQSGNPLGKKPGTRNRATVLREALRDGQDESVARVVIDKALAGNAVMARFVIGLLMPRPRDRAIEIDLPECGSAEDVLAASSATIQAMAQGEITPQEALSVTRLLEFRLKAMAAAGREAERAQARNSAKAKDSPSPIAQQSPSPLAGEGRGEGAGAGRDEMRQQPPHPPIAIAMGPSLSREGRGASRLHRRVETLADLLHSTCISRPPVPLPASLTGAALAA
jgi:hypothetical protein